MESALVSKSQEEQESLTIEQGEGEVETENNNYQLMIIPAAKDYECKYCPKKFSNKQALGGHQNAHKDLRAMEKETAGNGFFGMVPSFRHPDFLHRPSSYNWNFNLVPYNHCPGFNGGCVHRPWSSRFPPLRLPNFGPGTSNDFRSASHQGQGYPEFPTGFGIPPPSRNRPINLRNVPEVVDDESGIDLSLRLGYHDHV